MGKDSIYRWIKTDCGRAKYLELSNRSGFFSRIRLFVFVIVASLRDIYLPIKEQANQSDS